jgi:hypothetical protein
MLMLVCPLTGGAIDTGVRYARADLARVAWAKLHMRCPHCRATHEFSFADARLRPPGRVNGHAQLGNAARLTLAALRGAPDSRN